MNSVAHRRSLSARPKPAPELAPAVDWAEIGDSEHFVQIYESDRYLVEVVTEFLSTGFAAQNGGLVIATQPHRRAFEERLRFEGIDVEALKASGQFAVMDAGEALALFMVNGLPDRDRFFRTFEPLVGELGKGRRGVRAFGEMVASLWADGHQQAALQLERLWNELGQMRKFALCCAYPLQGITGEENGTPFLHVCQAHTRVIPSESYTMQRTAGDRLRCISVLQQKAGSVAAEIASRKQAEQVSHAEHAKLSMAVAIAELGTWEFDLETRALALSDQCRAHLGFSPIERVTYDSFLERVHTADRAMVEATFSTAITSGSDLAMEFRVATADGEVRWVSATGRQMNEGRARLLGASLDITERRNATASLERLVTERTQELSDTITDLEAFAYSMSHDLRTPLRSMRSYADVLLQECGSVLSPHGRHYLDRISDSALRMDRLIQDILAFSRLTRDGFMLEPVDLDRLTKAVVEGVRSSAQAASIAIEGELPWVIGNSTALTQCLSNLLDNAVKFVAPGVAPQVRVWSDLLPSRSGVDWVRVNVLDNGIGIPEKSHRAIFEMFQRSSKGYEGSGIGLAIVQKAIARMGGSVGLASEPDKGSLFWLELQRAPFTARTVLSA